MIVVVIIRLVGIMLQTFIIILFWMSLKISSLCSVLFFSCLWFYHCSPFTSKLLNTFSYIHFSKIQHTKTFFTLYSLLSLSWPLTFSKSLIFTTSSIVPEPRGLFRYIFLTCFILTYYAQYFAQSFNIILKVKLYS